MQTASIEQYAQGPHLRALSRKKMRVNKTFLKIKKHCLCKTKGCGILRIFAMQFVLAILGCAAVLTASCGSHNDLDGSNKISIDVGSLNPVEVGVLSPSKKFIFLRSDEFYCQGTKIHEGRVSIDPSSAAGYYWDADGKKSEVAVFNEIGIYAIYVSDNLETEFENSSAFSKKYSNRNASKASIGPDSCMTN